MKVDVDPIEVNSDLAPALVAHHLALAAAYFECCDGASGTAREAIMDILQAEWPEDHLALEAAETFVARIDAAYSKAEDARAERVYNLDQERLMEEGPGPSLLDQQREAMKYK